MLHFHGPSLIKAVAFLNTHGAFVALNYGAAKPLHLWCSSSVTPFGLSVESIRDADVSFNQDEQEGN